MRDLGSDGAALATFVSTIAGPVVLVGHSYGGAVITQATVSNVKALVYVTGYALAKTAPRGVVGFGVTARRPK